MFTYNSVLALLGLLLVLFPVYGSSASDQSVSPTSNIDIDCFVTKIWSDRSRDWDPDLITTEDHPERYLVVNGKVLSFAPDAGQIFDNPNMTAEEIAKIPDVVDQETEWHTAVNDEARLVAHTVSKPVIQPKGGDSISTETIVWDKRSQRFTRFLEKVDFLPMNLPEGVTIFTFIGTCKPHVAN